ncbi:MAG: class I SAM-dependent methyltransferase [Desulfobaccales bacterium]
MTFTNLLRTYLPKNVKNKLKTIILVWKKVNFRVRYGFYPPPANTDLVGYESIFEFIQTKNILNVPGDMVEIGVFCGGGTYKLAHYLLLNNSAKTIYAIDIFNISFDKTKNTDGIEMGNIYETIVKGKNQYEIFSQVINGLNNIVPIKEDSKKVTIPTNAISFAFIDGNHSPDYVQNDFYLVWEKLSPGGIVAFHDYGYDLPQVTEVIDNLYVKHIAEISNKYINKNKYICYFHKM